MADEKVVNEEQVSEVEPVSPESEVTPEVTELQALTEERVQQMIAEATARAVSEAKDAGRRELQSQQDRNRKELAEAQRRARFAEDSYSRIRGKVSELDPEASQALEAEEMRGQIGYYQSRDLESQQQGQMMATINAFEGNIAQFVSELGLDPSDKRIDWGDRSSLNLTQRQDKILKSVARIQKGSQESTIASLRQELKDEMQKFRKDNDLDFVDTSASSGISKGIPTDITKFREWVDGLSQEEYKAKEKDIDEMMQRGLIR